MPEDQEKSLSQFSAALIALATLAGTFVGALAVDMLWLFYVLVPAAVLVVIVRRSWPKLKRMLARSRAYDSLVSQLEEERKLLKQAREDVENLKVESARLEEAARQRGRNEVLGAAHSIFRGASLKAIGVAMRDDELVIVARSMNGSTPSVGSHYELVVAITGDKQGTLRVVELSADNDGALLTPVDEIVPSFWEELRRYARISTTVPDGLVLTIPTLPELANTERKTDA